MLKSYLRNTTNLTAGWSFFKTHIVSKSIDILLPTRVLKKEIENSQNFRKAFIKPDNGKNDCSERPLMNIHEVLFVILILMTSYRTKNSISMNTRTHLVNSNQAG